MCPHCGIIVQSKFSTDPDKSPRRMGELRYCPVCGVRLRLIRGINNMVLGVEVIGECQSPREGCEMQK